MIKFEFQKLKNEYLSLYFLSQFFVDYLLNECWSPNKLNLFLISKLFGFPETRVGKMVPALNEPRVQEGVRELSSFVRDHQKRAQQLFQQETQQLTKEEVKREIQRIKSSILRKTTFIKSNDSNPKTKSLKKIKKMTEKLKEQKNVNENILKEMFVPTDQMEKSRHFFEARQIRLLDQRLLNWCQSGFIDKKHLDHREFLKLKKKSFQNDLQEHMKWRQNN